MLKIIEMRMLKVVMIMILSNILIGFTVAQLQVGFYSKVCPGAEAVVAATVKDATRTDSRVPALMLRLHYHDCFVEGCDGSILIDNGNKSERQAFAHQGVGGYEVIESAKAQLESMCPGVVSCADIVALAARDAIAMTRGPAYEVELGRKDGFVSSMDLAESMPDVQDSIEILKQKFMEKGLDERDLVILTAAHYIGSTACFFMTPRLYNFASTGGPDPRINPGSLPELEATCPRGGDNRVRLPMDHGGGEIFSQQILQNIRSGFAVLQSDAALMDDPTTRGILNSYFNLSSPSTGPAFEADFMTSMVRMGRIGVKTGSAGNIRAVCNRFN